MRPAPIGELLAIPLQAAVRAQVLAQQETLAMLELVGIENGAARLFHLQAERTVEERVVNTTTGAAEIVRVKEPFELSIPVLALVPLQTIKLQEMDVDLAVEMVDVKEERLRSTAVPAEVRGPSLAGSPALLGSLTGNDGAGMKVHMKIVRDTSEGLARTNDLLTDLLNAKPVTRR